MNGASVKKVILMFFSGNDPICHSQKFQPSQTPPSHFLPISPRFLTNIRCRYFSLNIWVVYDQLELDWCIFDQNWAKTRPLHFQIFQILNAIDRPIVQCLPRFLFSRENNFSGNFKMSKIKMTKNVCKVLCNKLSRFLWIFLRMRVFVCPFMIFLLFTSFDLGVVPQKAKPPHFLNIWLRLDNGALCLHWERSLRSHWLIWQAIVD